jgi:spore coat polysaccharide biosynthesis protein SpsF
MKILILMRNGSSRLPGKHLINIGGRLILDAIAGNMVNITEDLQVIYCIPDTSSNDSLYLALKKRGLTVFRGSESNVLLRLKECIAHYEDDIYVRLNGDNIFMTSSFLYGACLLHKYMHAEFSTNVGKRSMPKGLSFQIFSHEFFQKYYVANKDNLTAQEHVFINPEKFTERYVNLEFQGLSSKYESLALDTTEDLELIKDMIINNKTIFWND